MFEVDCFGMACASYGRSSSDSKEKDTGRIFVIRKNFGARGLVRALFVTSLIAVGGTAHATIVSSASNNPLNFTWDFDTGSSHLTGFGSMVVTGFNSSTLTVSVSLSNTSLIGGVGGERLTAFGFGIDPNATGATFVDANDAGMIDATLSSIPSLATIEVCAYGGSNCQGGSNGGIFAGDSDSFQILLAGTWGSSVNIAPIGFKYQTGYGSFEFTSSSSSGTPSSSGTTVPEPTTLSLLGASLLGVALMRRRRKQQKAA
jgi:hypothetical protein